MLYLESGIQRQKERVGGWSETCRVNISSMGDILNECTGETNICTKAKLMWTWIFNGGIVWSSGGSGKCTCTVVLVAVFPFSHIQLTTGVGDPGHDVVCLGPWTDWNPMLCGIRPKPGKTLNYAILWNGSASNRQIIDSRAGTEIKNGKQDKERGTGTD